MKNRTLYGWMTVGAVVGLVASFMQLLEKIQLLSQTGGSLVCDINSIFSCSAVLSAWQSSVFGFPNAMLCLVFFTIFASIALVGWAGGTLPRRLRVSIHGLALIMLGFGLWSLWQDVFVIGALCVLCVFCFGGLLIINWGWLRLNASDLPIGQSLKKRLERTIQRGADTFWWAVLAAIVVLAMVARFNF